jgi:hypothetical protein
MVGLGTSLVQREYLPILDPHYLSPSILKQGAVGFAAVAWELFESNLGPNTQLTI